MRPCIEAGCPALTNRTRCTTHERLRERRRGTPSQRGYDSRHQAARLALKAMLPDECGYGCGTWLLPDGDWVAAHVQDGNPSAGWIAACRTCNERAKTRR
jgi:hypothetical protein